MQEVRKAKKTLVTRFKIPKIKMKIIDLKHVSAQQLSRFNSDGTINDDHYYG